MIWTLEAEENGPQCPSKLETGVHGGCFIAERGWLFSMLSGAIVDVNCLSSIGDARSVDEKILSTIHF